jgi:aspartate 1-decarboxylase
MFRIMCKSKIHRAKVTATALNYKGSIGIDASMLKASDIFPGERVQIVNLNNGERFETYTIAESEGSGAVCLYGPAARLGQVGDKVIVLSYALYEDKEAASLKTRVLYVDEDNKPAEA